MLLPPLFVSSKKKKGKQRKKIFKSLQSSNYQNVTVLAIIKHLEFEMFSCLPTMVMLAVNTFQSLMAPPLPFEIHSPGTGKGKIIKKYHARQEKEDSCFYNFFIL